MKWKNKAEKGELWYELLTNEVHFKQFEKFIAFALSLKFFSLFLLCFLFSGVHATLQPALSVGLSVCQSVNPSVCQSVSPWAVHQTFFLLFQRLQAVVALLLLPKCLVSHFYHYPCQAARDSGSCVSVLVFNVG